MTFEKSGDLLQNIIVPTLDTARTHYLIDVCVNHNRPVLFCGPTGTGKSAYIKQKLMGADDSKFVTTFINFSAKTTANQTQNLIMSRLDKRRKEGVMFLKLSFFRIFWNARLGNKPLFQFHFFSFHPNEM